MVDKQKYLKSIGLGPQTATDLEYAVSRHANSIGMSEDERRKLIEDMMQRYRYQPDDSYKFPWKPFIGDKLPPGQHDKEKLIDDLKMAEGKRWLEEIKVKLKNDLLRSLGLKPKNKVDKMSSWYGVDYAKIAQLKNQEVSINEYRKDLGFDL